MEQKKEHSVGFSAASSLDNTEAEKDASHGPEKEFSKLKTIFKASFLCSFMGHLLSFFSPSFSCWLESGEVIPVEGVQLGAALQEKPFEGCPVP